MARTGDRVFRVTAFIVFAAQTFLQKIIERVGDVGADDAVRYGCHDSEKEHRRRRRQKHLEFFGSDSARIGWDREMDYTLVGEFIRGNEPSLSLANPPPTWQMAIAWFCGPISNTRYWVKSPAP